MVAPLLRPEALSLQPALALRRGIQLPLQQMHARLWKVADAARVIEVEMRQDDMTHILRLKAEIDDLLPGAEPAIELNIIEKPEKARQPARVRHILQADAGIHQHQSVRVGFQQQTVAAEVSQRRAAESVVERAAEGTHTAAVEVMNAHGFLLAFRRSGQRAG